MKSIGIVLILIGILLLVLGMVCMFASLSAYYVGASIFGSVVLNVVGAMLMSSKTKKRNRK